MTPEEFEIILSPDDKYGLCSPPIKAQKALNILIDHFLGNDWYDVMPQGTEQTNSEAVYLILKNYPKRNLWKAIKNLFTLKKKPIDTDDGIN